MIPIRQAYVLSFQWIDDRCSPAFHFEYRFIECHICSWDDQILSMPGCCCGSSRSCATTAVMLSRGHIGGRMGYILTSTPVSLSLLPVRRVNFLAPNAIEALSWFITDLLFSTSKSNSAL